MRSYQCISKRTSILKSWATDFLQECLFIPLIIHLHELDVLVFANILHSLTIYRVIHELEEVFFKGILSPLSFLSIKGNIWGKPVSLVEGKDFCNLIYNHA